MLKTAYRKCKSLDYLHGGNVLSVSARQWSRHTVQGDASVTSSTIRQIRTMLRQMLFRKIAAGNFKRGGYRMNQEQIFKK